MYVKGDLFQSPAKVLVNTVNTVGAMGKGIALQFKNMFPDMYVKYRSLCEQGLFEIGQLWLYKTPNKWVLNFPTKKHWRYPSKIEYMELGLKKFVNTYDEMGIHSIAFPPLGCGNGQLDFEDQVKPVMEKYLRNLPIEVFIYPDRESDFIEHLNPGKMSDWLRSEPTSLPFSEVWEDLTRLIKQQKEFETIASGNPFRAEISENPLGIKITASSTNYYIKQESLMSFWQQLRTHGFSMRHIAPSIDRQIYYLIPIFAHLDYVAPVHVADQYERLNTSVVTGLQIMPTAPDKEIEQLSFLKQVI